MAVSNRERVAKGFELLRLGLVPYVERELKKLGVPAADTTHKGRPVGKGHVDTQAVLKTLIDIGTLLSLKPLAASSGRS